MNCLFGIIPFRLNRIYFRLADIEDRHNFRSVIILNVIFIILYSFRYALSNFICSYCSVKCVTPCD